MNRRSALTLLLAVALLPSLAYSSNQADDLWIIAAGRGPGAADSLWKTDLYVMNVSGEEVDLDITYFPRGGGAPKTRRFVLADSDTLTLNDVLATTFGEDFTFGAIRVELVKDLKEQHAGQDEAALVAHARIYDQRQSGTVGQSLEGMSSASAIAAGGTSVTTHVIGVSNNAAYRSNWFAMNIDASEDAAPAEVLVELLDAHGSVIASREYALPARTPAFHPLAEIAPSLTDATLRFTMLGGRALFGASKIDMVTNDPTTLETHTRGLDDSSALFTDEFQVETCVFTPNGTNPFFPLTPGLELTFEGEDDGEEIENVIEVLEETIVIAGVTARVVTETEYRDGELVEISRNYFAECVATGDVFYFGEDVDIYEDGRVVSHEGAWRAGAAGARAGIIMPGRALAGSRYYQELAPGVALDRAEHVRSGLRFQTPAGTFSNCVSVRESSALDGSATSFKVYCPDVGLVFDSGAELTELTAPQTEHR